MSNKRQWLKDIRTEKGLTMNTVSVQSGISKTYYDKIERGERNASVKVAKRIAQTLGFPWGRFFEEVS